MRKIIGIGETVFDILFKDDQPVKAAPGGSVFNTVISLGRLGLEPYFIGEVGRDKVGQIILSFMQKNNVKTENMYFFYEKNSPVSLAFESSDHATEYDDYVNYPDQRLDIIWPRLNSDDIIIFGSYYSLTPAIRPALTDLLNYASEMKVITICDPHYKAQHSAEATWVMPAIIENLEFADIVRGSIDDFRNMYKETDVDKIYKNHIKFYCPNFICTDSLNGVYLRTASISKHYSVPQVDIVSKDGAGDSFNAGMIYSLNRLGILRDNIPTLEEKVWDMIIADAIDFATEVCLSNENYISQKKADTMR